MNSRSEIFIAKLPCHDLRRCFHSFKNKCGQCFPFMNKNRLCITYVRRSVAWHYFPNVTWSVPRNYIPKKSDLKLIMEIYHLFRKYFATLAIINNTAGWIGGCNINKQNRKKNQFGRYFGRPFFISMPAQDYLKCYFSLSIKIVHNSKYSKFKPPCTSISVPTFT